MTLRRSSFSFGFSDFWVSVNLQGFQLPQDPESQVLGELSLRQDRIHQIRIQSDGGAAVILDELPVGAERYGNLRFAPHQLALPELSACLRTLDLFPDPAVYEAIAPPVASLARKLANPSRSLGFVMVAQLKILSIEYVDQVFDDLTDSMNLLQITNLSFVAGDDDGEMGPCSICLGELSGGCERELVRVPCSHVYHKSCILRWLHMKKTTCPICRRQLNVQ